MKPKVQVLSILTTVIFTAMGYSFTSNVHSENCHKAAAEEQARAHTQSEPVRPNNLGFVPMDEFNKTYPVHTCTTFSSEDFFNLLMGGIVAYIVAALGLTFFFKLTD
jgi:hypothetical protein